MDHAVRGRGCQVGMIRSKPTLDPKGTAMTKQGASEDGETTSVTEKAKSLLKKKKVIIGAAGIVATSLFIAFRSAGKFNKRDDEEGWSKEEADWYNSLSIEDFVELNMLVEYGVHDEEGEEKLEEFRRSYQEATGEKWE
jgi:hypothetical protein